LGQAAISGCFCGGRFSDGVFPPVEWEVLMLRRQVLLLAGAIAVWPRVLVAQASEEADQSVRVGDRWTYEGKDEITGETKGTLVEVVTDVSDKEFDIRVTVRGKQGGRLIAYDHDWNRLDDSTWKFKPHDGRGIRRPLEVGKEWRSEFECSNMHSGTILNATSKTKVTAQEALTTPAGTFDTFKIETKTTEYSTDDPSRGSDTEFVIWYAPRINHWVRRTSLIRSEKRVRSSSSEELVDFSRKL
jgi:hypothetical protein